MKTKKAEIVWDTIAKLMLALVFLVFITIVIFFYKDKLMAMLETLKSYMRFR